MIEVKLYSYPSCFFTRKITKIGVDWTELKVKIFNAIIEYNIFKSKRIEIFVKIGRVYTVIQKVC